MKKRLIILIGVTIVSQMAMAQWRLSASVSLGGNCSGSIEAGVWKAAAKAIVEHYNGKNYASRQECEQARMSLISNNSGNMGGCSVRIIASCNGSGGVSNGAVDILGVGKGSSFYSINPVNEINDWSSDDMERMLALNPEYKPILPNTIATGDFAFDKIIENMPYSNEAFSGRMPRGNTSLIQLDRPIVPTQEPNRGTGIVIPDEYFEGKTFDPRLGEWSSSDLNSININLGSNTSMENQSGIDKNSNSLSDILSSLDYKLDYYNALEQGDANFLQYMYTRWGKENVMEGIYWWEKNNMSSRISNTYNSIQDAISNTVMHPIDTYNNLRNGAIEGIKDNVDMGVGSTIRFLLPPQYKETSERTQAIYDTEKGIITDVLKTVKEAPDMISRGETIDITQTLGNANDKVQGLAVSYGSPEMSKAYGKLKSAADIYNLPQEEQKKGLLDMFKKEGKGIVKSEIKNSGYYKKIEKNSKKIVDPFNFIFE